MILRAARSPAACSSLLKTFQQNAFRDAFYLVDLRLVSHQLRKWRTLLPTVEPFYAFKCNSDPVIASTLAREGASFDCASAGEIDTILRVGGHPSGIVYANPIKQDAHLRFAKSRGVRLTVVDSVAELEKIARVDPDTGILIRLATDDRYSTCRFSEKFGATLDTARILLQRAGELGVRIVGVSYHVGSGCFDVGSYVRALQTARTVFDWAAHMGRPMNVLDLGGGFPGSVADVPRPEAVDGRGDLAWDDAAASPLDQAAGDGSSALEDRDSVLRAAGCAPRRATFPEIAATLRDNLARLFPNQVPARGEQWAEFVRGVEPTDATPVFTLAEPGRYMVQASHSLFVQVIGTNQDPTGRGGEPVDPRAEAGSVKATQPRPRVYVNDGLYGSFNSVIYDHASVHPIHLPDRLVEQASNVSGPIGARLLQLALQRTGAHGVTPLPENWPEDLEPELGSRYLPEGPARVRSSLWGHTCDGFDCIARDVYLPHTEAGDWLGFDDMGAYTIAAAATFNGFQPPNKAYVPADLPLDFSEEENAEVVDLMLRTWETSGESMLPSLEDIFAKDMSLSQGWDAVDQYGSTRLPLQEVWERA